MAARAARGVSLIEVLVVVALVAALAAGLAATLGGGMAGLQLRGTAREMAAQIRHTRGLAIVRGEPQFFEIDVTERRWTAPDGRGGTLPRALELRVLGAAEEQIEDDVARIRFFPDGSSSGGVVRLRRDGAEWRVDVAWLTGEVRVRRGEAP